MLRGHKIPKVYQIHGWQEVAPAERPALAFCDARLAGAATSDRLQALGLEGAMGQRRASAAALADTTTGCRLADRRVAGPKPG
jgi:hypothetical protein